MSSATTDADRHHAELRAHLADRDVPCPGCGYNLRGLVGSACPECREAIELRVGLVEPRLGAIIAVLAGLWSAAGTAFALVAGMLVLSMVFRDWAPGSLWFAPSIALVLAIPALVLLCPRKGRAWLRARGRGVRIAAILASWALFVGFVSAWIYAVTQL